jgi:hypothetical protein
VIYNEAINKIRFLLGRTGAIWVSPVVTLDKINMDLIESITENHVIFTDESFAKE